MKRIIRCLFCGCDTTDCKSVEHIIPESLGNSELILPKGVVCDKCNNYFSREIENKVLSIQSFRDLCFYKCIPNKKGRFKSTKFLLCGEECKVDWGMVDGMPVLLLGASPKTIKSTIEKKPKIMISKRINLDDKNHAYEISRFLYKIAIEYYVLLSLEVDEHKDADCFETDDGIAKIINYVRKGNKNKKYFVYNSSTENRIDPFSGERIIKLNLFEKDNDLVFEMNLFGTIFSVNLSRPIYND